MKKGNLVDYSNTTIEPLTPDGFNITLRNVGLFDVNTSTFQPYDVILELKLNLANAPPFNAGFVIPSIKSSVPPSLKPTAEFSHTVDGCKVNFDASNSSDEDGSITDYSWDFGDGTRGSGKIASHTYSRNGSFNVTLTVKDNDGLQDSKSVTINVTGCRVESLPKITNVGISKEDANISELSLTAQPGQRIKLWYEITNQGSQNIEAILGATIVDPTGKKIDNPNDDKPITVITSTQWYSRFFDIPSDAIEGAYRVMYGLWKSDKSKSYDLVPKDNLLTIEIIVTFPPKQLKPDLILPFADTNPWMLTNGYNVKGDHDNFGPWQNDQYALDFAAAGCGAWDKPIVAMADGIIEDIDRKEESGEQRNDKIPYMWQYGNTIIIDHGNGYKSRYAHLNSVSISEGEKVIQGQEIGRCGNSGRVIGTACPEHPGTHIHIALYHAGNAEKPEPMLSRDGPIYEFENKVGKWFYSVFSSPLTPDSPRPPNKFPIALFTMTSGSQSAQENQTLNLTVSPGGTASVSFSASRSYGPDGSISSYRWTINGSEVSTSKDFTFSLGKGTHSVQLTVTDNKGATGSVGGTIIVQGVKFKIGDTVEVYNTGGIGLIVRDTPCGSRIGNKPDGALGVVQDGPNFCDNYNRWKIRWSDGLVGWSAEDWLRRR